MPAASDFPIIPFSSQAEWETWLEESHGSSDGIWLRMFKKGSGVESVSHDGALDVALCFGWIDGQGKPFDDQSWLQKFTPRRPRSVWSKRNTEKVERLISEGRMRPAGLREIEAAKADGRWQKAYDSSATATVPDDFLAALEAAPKAKELFATLNRQNTFAIAYRLQTAKKPETRERRIRQFIEMLANGKKLYP
jgi:uncharacterized protein YdeI (YjbR/CyaY-like superfamily)